MGDRQDKRPGLEQIEFLIRLAGLPAFGLSVIRAALEARRSKLSQRSRFPCHISSMPLVDLYGHEEIRALLSESAASGKLPGSLLLHGPRGVGKQRLALWLGQLLLCSADEKPCGKCRACEYSRSVTHPDLHWYFPRPRLKDADPALADVVDDYQDAVAERLANGGLYAAPPGNEGIFVATVRAIVQQASLTPAMALKKVFVIGDAERMVPQEGAEYAANAFLKLLEEPSPKTTLILTSSEPGALLPTIRSRAVSIRVPPLSDAAMRSFLADPTVSEALDKAGAPRSAAERLSLAGGAPGELFGDEARGRAIRAARKLLDAALAPRESARHAAVLAVGASGARGAFSDTLDAMLMLVGERMRAALHDSDEARALAASRAADAVARARDQAGGNVNPQLIAARLLRELSASLS